ncbi:MAG: Phytochrome, two-component sensor histidine kinase [Pseudomonas sp.]|nr:Phytochrome, two-component sensor histidine kinase [Pseudomonas sp.]
MTTMAPGSPPAVMDDCANEPIHIPGSIQPHGVLLVVVEAELTVMQASANAAQLFGMTPAQLTGKPLAAVLGNEYAEAVRWRLADLATGDDDPLRVTVAGQVFDVLLHRHRGALILELEPIADDVADQQKYMARALRRMQAATTLPDLYQIAVNEIQALTGYERVMIYRFEEEGHGQVIGEAVIPGMQPYLGHFFPASDIPPQARELYRLNWIRVIPDADYRPVPILPVLRPDTGQPLDLSFAVLRSVSPVHCEYLKNMGVRSSMSISLVKNDRLWGLVTCHHRQTLKVSHELRVAGKSIGQLLSMQVGMLEDQESRHQEEQKNVLLGELVRAMEIADSEVLEGLIERPQALMDLTDASGVAVLIDNRVHLFGQCPTVNDVRLLYRWVRKQATARFQTASLGAEFAPAVSYKAVASGLLVFMLPKPLDNAVMWFRAETKSTMNWSGNPDKVAGQGSSVSGRLRPRLSFDLWKQQVEGTSRRWGKGDVYAVEGLRRSALENDLSRQVEREHQAVRARDELVAVVSHDLRNPMTIIAMQCGMLQKLIGRDDSHSTRRMESAIDTLQQATSRMNTMLDDLLDTSKIEAGRFRVSLRSTDVGLMLEQICETLEPLAAAKQIALIYHAAPDLLMEADPERMFQVFSNLLGNAIKFTPPTGAITVSAEAQSGNVLFTVEDNGIGINPSQLPHIFERYWTGREGNPRGTGLGLYISHGIVEAHGGRLWVHSEPGQGSVFSFTIPSTH